jgi:MFS family permease
MSTTLASRARFARALRSPSFALLWAGQTISVLGDGAFTVALAWSILLLTGSAAALAIVLIAQSVPRLIFLLVGGVLADRLPRRLILFWSDGSRAVAVLLIAVLYWTHFIALWQIIGLSVVFGIADAFFMPAYSAIPPQLVPEDDLASANALNGLSQQAGSLIGPALGALFVALTSPAAAFALDGATFVFSAFCLLAMRMPHVVEQRVDSPTKANAGERSGAATGLLGEIREGFAYLMSWSWLWVNTLFGAVANIGLATLAVSLPLLVHKVYGEGVWLLGAMVSADAIGAMAAALLIGQLPQLHRRGIIAYLGIILNSLALFLLGVPVPHQAVVFVALAASSLIGFGLGIFSVIYLTVVQQMVPADKLGRVSAIDWIGSLAFQPIGLAVVGIVTDRLGPTLIFLVAGGFNAVLALFFMLSVRGIRDLD